MANIIKILLVDDSRMLRTILKDVISNESDMQVIGEAANGKEALKMIASLKPDVISLDVEMPVMNGLQVLQKIKKSSVKIPVIMLSGLTQAGAEITFKALELGAFDFISKQSETLSVNTKDLARRLVLKIRMAAGSRSLTNEFNEDFTEKKLEIKQRNNTEKFDIPDEIKIMGIGSSTGGPAALSKIFQDLPEDLPFPIVVVQHMPEGFTALFAKRLDGLCSISIKEAENGDRLSAGKVYIAKGDYHLEVKKDDKGFYLRSSKRKEVVSGHRPSVDVLFNSINDVVGRNSFALILTGMGRDGAEGMLKLSHSGALTMGQDEKSSIVYGMNKQAYLLGALRWQLPLDKIAEKIKNVALDVNL